MPGLLASSGSARFGKGILRITEDVCLVNREGLNAKICKRISSAPDSSEARSSVMGPKRVKPWATYSWREREILKGLRRLVLLLCVRSKNFPCVHSKEHRPK